MTLMRPDSNSFNLIIPHDVDFQRVESIHPLEPYNPIVLDFLDAWSKQLLLNKESRLYPDVITFAFWIRKGHIRLYKEAFEKQNSDELRLGRGCLFHIAPSNVPINFAYSLTVGLLSGNANIVRVSKKDFRQVTLLSDELDALLQKEQWRDMHDFITLVRYDRSNKALTDYFSSLADIRIIWGGDTTLDEIRSSKIPPRSFDICFADRYSLCVIDADTLLQEKDLSTIVQGFYNDTFLFDQNACTAPHLIIWLGKKESKEKAKMRFWDAVQAYTESKYEIVPITAVDKLTAFCMEAITHDGVERKKSKNNTITRIQLNQLPIDIETCRSIGGYFNEYDATTLDELTPIITRKFQTLSYFGLGQRQLQDFIKRNRLVGIDRCVPIGKTLDFDPIWDGWNLITSMSKVIHVL